MLNNLKSAILIGVSLCILADKAEAASIKEFGESTYICADQRWPLFKEVGSMYVSKTIDFKKALFKGECMKLIGSNPEKYYFKVQGISGNQDLILKSSKAEFIKLGLEAYLEPAD